MKVNHIFAVIYKQYCDTLNNKMVIFMMFMYPVMTFAFHLLLEPTSEVLDFISPIFVTMHIIMSPIVCFASVISEEKEKNTLRMLFLSNISGIEYLLGISSCLVVFLLISTIPYYFLLHCSLEQGVVFFWVSFFGILCSSILGAIIGMLSKNQISVGTVASPVSMILGLLPMMANFNSYVMLFSNFFYSQRIYNIVFTFRTSEFINLKPELIVFAINAVTLAILFSVIYSRKGPHMYD